MPGPHLDMKLMQCWPDVGGCDCWVGGYWDPEAKTQWWTGWHLPGPAGLAGLRNWTWPNPKWTLIGYELWASYKKGDRLIEAYYAYPNPSTTPSTQQQQVQPSGHWHVAYHPNGAAKSSWWSDDTLVDEHCYLKGSSSPKGGRGGKGRKGKGKGHKGKGKGKL